jgi:hypothetical protein
MEGGFKSDMAAQFAGKKAFEDFLAGLTEEERRSAKKRSKAASVGGLFQAEMQRRDAELTPPS